MNFDEQMTSLNQVFNEKRRNEAIKRFNSDPPIYKKIDHQPKEKVMLDESKKKKANRLKLAAGVTVAGLVIGGYIAFESNRLAKWDKYMDAYYDRITVEHQYEEELSNKPPVIEDSMVSAKPYEEYIKWLQDNPNVHNNQESYKYFLENIYNSDPITDSESGRNM